MSWSSVSSRPCSPAPIHADQRTAMHPENQRAYFRAVVVAWFILFLGFGGIVVASLTLSPEKLASGAYPLAPACPTKALFGCPCPTCGIGRALAAFGHGRVADAFRYHPVSPLAYGFLWAGAILGAVQTLRTVREMKRSGAGRNVP